MTIGQAINRRCPFLGRPEEGDPSGVGPAERFVVFGPRMTMRRVDPEIPVRVRRLGSLLVILRR